jgi:hypothetical protein
MCIYTCSFELDILVKNLRPHINLNSRSLITSDIIGVSKVCHYPLFYNKNGCLRKWISSRLDDLSTIVVDKVLCIHTKCRRGYLLATWYRKGKTRCQPTNVVKAAPYHTRILVRVGTFELVSSTTTKYYGFWIGRYIPIYWKNNYSLS